MPRVTVIEPTVNPITKAPIYQIIKRKVAAYARVSTDSDEQYTSYETQVEYYTKYIQEKNDWEYVDTYADEGRSGTSTKSRDGFNRMIVDALSGKIDLIITKSISRFARNTLDTIQKVRELKSHHVEVYFEKENIWTFDPKSELILTIMASIAQEESRSISQNVTWGKRKTFAKGKVSIPFGSFLGYKKGDNGEIAIDEEEAEIVKEIYRLFLFEGLTCHSIANRLTKLGYETAKGTKKWSKNGIRSILTNEKYKGDALLQKGYVENSHPAIIERRDWEMVQLELARRESITSYYSCNDIFATKLICEDCGGFYGRKVWHSNDSYRRVVYQCNHKFDSKKVYRCETPHLLEQEIIDKFLLAYDKVITNKEEVVESLEEVVELLGNYDELDFKIEEARTEAEVVDNMVKALIEKRTKTNELSEEEFTKQYEQLDTRYKNLGKKMNSLLKEKEIKKGKKEKMSAILENFKQCPTKLLRWNKETWMRMVEIATVHRDKTITFKFYSGQEVRV